MVRDLEGGDIFGTGSLLANEVARFRTPLSFEREVHYVTFDRTPGKPLFVFFIMVVLQGLGTTEFTNFNG